MKGCFIVFEGIDGSGKTTLINLTAEALSGKGCRVKITREPGGTGLGDHIRDVLLFGNERPEPLAEALLYIAARAQNVSANIIPALKEGMLVLSDRFSDSTYAYQGYGRGVDRGLLDRVNSYACRGLSPDITVLLDIDPALAAARMDRLPDRMEREGLAFMRRVRAGYLARAAGNPAAYLVLDASLPPADLLAEIMSEIMRRLDESRC